MEGMSDKLYTKKNTKLLKIIDLNKTLSIKDWICNILSKTADDNKVKETINCWHKLCLGNNENY